MIAENNPPQTYERPELGQETLTSTLTKVGDKVVVLRNLESGSLAQELPA